MFGIYYKDCCPGVLLNVRSLMRIRPIVTNCSWKTMIVVTFTFFYPHTLTGRVVGAPLPHSLCGLGLSSAVRKRVGKLCLVHSYTLHIARVHTLLKMYIYIVFVCVCVYIVFVCVRSRSYMRCVCVCARECACVPASMCIS